MYVSIPIEELTDKQLECEISRVRRQLESTTHSLLLMQTVNNETKVLESRRKRLINLKQALLDEVKNRADQTLQPVDFLKHGVITAYNG